MYLVIECTRFNINWVFMFLSSVYLICHCQFLYRMAFVFSSLFLPVHTFFRHKFVFTHTHKTRVLNFAWSLHPQAKWKARRSDFLSVFRCVCVCVDRVLMAFGLREKSFYHSNTEKRCGLLIYFIIKLCRYRRIILRFIFFSFDCIQYQQIGCDLYANGKCCE